MGFQLVYPQIHTGLPGLDEGDHNTGGNHTAQLHSYQVEDTDFNICGQGGNPQPDRYKNKKQDNKQSDNTNDTDYKYVSHYKAPFIIVPLPLIWNRLLLLSPDPHLLIYTCLQILHQN